MVTKVLVILFGRGWWCLAITRWADARKGSYLKRSQGKLEL